MPNKECFLRRSTQFQVVVLQASTLSSNRYMYLKFSMMRNVERDKKEWSCQFVVGGSHISGPASLALSRIVWILRVW